MLKASMHSVFARTFRSLSTESLEALLQSINEHKNNEEMRESVTVYSLMQGWSGGMYVVENRSPNKSIHVQCDCKGSTNIVSTRGTLTTIYSIPPLHRQVIMILTQLESTVSFHVSRRLLHRMNLTPTGLGNWAPAGVNHEPYLTLDVEGLHAPRPL